jgi:transcription elongation factor GreA
MTSTERIWMTREAHTRLQTELAALHSRPSIEVPDDFMDYDDNFVASYAARQARIRQIQDLLTNAVVGEDPPDDGIAEPGMVLTIRYDDTGEIETFLLGVRGAEDADIEVYSMQSPLGSAIAGARTGEQRTYSIPSGSNLPVTLLKAVPYGMHLPNGRRPPSDPPPATATAGDPRPGEQAAARQPSAHRRPRVAPPPLARPAGRNEQLRAAAASSVTTRSCNERY